MTRTASMILGLALAACGGPKEAAAPPQADPPPPVDVTPPAATTATPALAEAAPAPSAEATPPAPIVVAPMTLTVEEVGKPQGKMTLELTADGTIKGKGKGSEKTLKFVGNELRDESGAWVARVLSDGALEVQSTHVSKRNGKVEKEEKRIDLVGRFDANDELSVARGGSVRVDDKGSVILNGVDQKTAPTKGVKLFFSGVTPATRRAATILFVSIFAPSRSESDMSESTSPPGVSATPRELQPPGAVDTERK